MTTQILKKAEVEIVHRCTLVPELDEELRRTIVEAVCDKYHVSYNVMYAQLGIEHAAQHVF